MAKTLKLLLTIFFFLAAAYHIQAADHHVQCWHCSSDTIGAEDFCGTVFNEDNIPTELMKGRNISVIRSCNSTINSEHERAVCRKTVEETNGKTITKRFCYYTNKSDPLDHCSQETTEKSVRRVFCQDCLTNRCNSASQMAAVWGTMLLPLLLAKVFVV